MEIKSIPKLFFSFVHTVWIFYLIVEKYPKLKTQTQFSMAINMEYATDEQFIKNDDTVALIPPVSGG